MIFRKPEASSPTANVEASGAGAVAVGGAVNAPITTHHTVVLPRRQVSWPATVGVLPALASAFQPRHELMARIGHGTSGEQSRTAWMLSGGGGVGKTQLAAWTASRAIEDPHVDLVVWISADSQEQVIGAYARCAHQVGAEVTGDAAKDATSFLEWLRSTDRAWLIVLDDITDAAHMRSWWPPARPNGSTLATTRLRDAALTGSGRQRIDIDMFTSAESATYLSARLTEVGLSHLLDDQIASLAEELGHLPLALAHAAAYMENQEESCATYLERYRNGRDRIADLMPADNQPDGYDRAVAVTLLIALDAADAVAPVGLARPSLILASILDPAGIPESLWATAAVTKYLTRYRAGGGNELVDVEQARRSLRLLHRYALINHSSAESFRAVRIHSLTARAAREAQPDLNPSAMAAADALVAIWPTEDYVSTGLVAVLQANAAAVITHAEDHLWDRGSHPLILRAGNSLLRSGLHKAATGYWRKMAAKAQLRLGPSHIHTVGAQLNLASSYWQAGHTAEAIAIEEKVLADSERVSGMHHPGTMIAQVNLAATYRQAGRTTEAITLLVEAVDGLEMTLGREHSHALTARTNLMSCLVQAERLKEAIQLGRSVAADFERTQGPDAYGTLVAKKNLAAAYQRAKRIADAVALFEIVVPDMARCLGEEHPEVLSAQAQLAFCYVLYEQVELGIALSEAVLPVMERVLGVEHPETLTARGNLASFYIASGRIDDAIACLKTSNDAFERILGPKHTCAMLARMLRTVDADASGQ